MELVRQLLRGMGARAVDGRWGEIEFTLALSYDSGGSDRSHSEPQGTYVSVRFPRSLMADLLVETRRNCPPCADLLEPFAWSGTTDEWARSQLEGPLLTLIARQNEYRTVVVKDEELRIGPLPDQVDEATTVVADILTEVCAHFAKR